ncbi:MAG: hypothetical protein AAF800_04935 [Planctomycetota bacterium]
MFPSEAYGDAGRPPRLEPRSIDRPDPPRGGFRPLVLLGGLALAGILCFGFLRNGYESLRLKTGETQQVYAEVVSESRGGRRLRKDGEYAFVVGQEVFFGFVDGRKTGDRVPVSFLVSDPTINRPTNAMGTDFVPLGVGAAIFVVWLLFAKKPMLRPETDG